MKVACERGANSEAYANRSEPHADRVERAQLAAASHAHIVAALVRLGRARDALAGVDVVHATADGDAKRR